MCLALSQVNKGAVPECYLVSGRFVTLGWSLEPRRGEDRIPSTFPTFQEPRVQVKLSLSQDNSSSVNVPGYIVCVEYICNIYSVNRAVFKDKV